MVGKAAKRGHIRKAKSLARENAAKQIVIGTLAGNDFHRIVSRQLHGRHVIDAIDSLSRKRVIWFKLGWSPGSKGDTAVQIAMLKATEAEKASSFSARKVRDLVFAKMTRAEQDGVTDLLLFSLDASDTDVIAALLLPIKEAPKVFEKCLQSDEEVTRKGASPVFWLIGGNARQRALEELLRENCVDLLARDALLLDAINDLEPDEALLGNATPRSRLYQTSAYPRDKRIRKNALGRAQGNCEFCGVEGFLMDDGTRYLECHHIQALGDEGPDTVENVIALCPNDHRRAHFAFNRDELAAQMRSKLRAILES